MPIFYLKVILKYLGAATKGATAATSLRTQPFSTLWLNNWAYSFEEPVFNQVNKKLKSLRCIKLVII